MLFVFFYNTLEFQWNFHFFFPIGLKETTDEPPTQAEQEQEEEQQEEEREEPDIPQHPPPKLPQLPST